MGPRKRGPRPLPRAKPSIVQAEVAPFTFARLPTELKLEVLRYHTSYLHEHNYVWFGRCRRVALGLRAFRHGEEGSPGAFHPNAIDLILLHFPREAQTMPLPWFEKFHGPHTGWVGALQLDEHWEGLKERFSIGSRELRDIPVPILWLRYLALIASRIRDIVQLVQQHSYEQIPAEATCQSLLHLWRFLSPFKPTQQREFTARFDYIACLPLDKGKKLRKVVDLITRTLTSSLLFDTFETYEGFVDELQFSTESQDIQWRHFLQCGAYRFCLLHYLLQRRPHEFANALTATMKRGMVRFEYEPTSEKPYTSDSDFFLEIESHGEAIITRFGEPLLELDEASLDRIKAWIWTDHWYCKETRALCTTPVLHTLQSPIQRSLSRYNVVEELLEDCIDALHGYELPRLFEEHGGAGDGYL